MKEAFTRWDGHQVKVVVGENQYLMGYVHRVYEDHVILKTSKSDPEETYIPFHAIRYWSASK